MDTPTVYRYAGDTDHEHAARVDGFDAGFTHQNYVTAYGPTAESTCPTRFGDVAEHWLEAYEQGKDEYDALDADAEAYGHDWRQLEPVERD